VSDSANEPTPHRRRQRYRGTHPRRFEEKYKELAPDTHPELIAHVRARGMTPAGQHVPIMVDEVLTALDVRPGQRGVDATLGYGGHARALLERLAPGGRLIALDADPLETPKTQERLRKLGYGADVLVVRRTNFAGLSAVLSELELNAVDFVFADLGLSSMQIDDPARGFTFKHDGPLDMRMNPSRGLSAAEWLARADEATLERVLTDNADEPLARDLSRVLTGRRERIESTRALAELVRRSTPERYDDDEREKTVRRVFQALRIEVNDEFGVLDLLLRQLPQALASSGRVAILSFHSGEDRRVKRAFSSGLAAGVYSRASDELVRSSSAELRANPRAASAKLRWAQRAC